MKPRFLADADFNQKIVTGLRRKEPAIDFLSAVEGGVIGLADPEVLRAAADLGRILVSHDRRTMPPHFAKFLEMRSSPGLLIAAQSMDIGDAIEELLLVWVATEAGEWIDRVGFLPI